MLRSVLPWALALGVLAMAGCREPLDFSRSATADADRGKRLYMANCANTCHPDNAFDQKRVKDYEELAYTVRDYLRQVEKTKAQTAKPKIGEKGGLLSRANFGGLGEQDVFDIARYLNDTYYKFDKKSFHNWSDDL